MADERRRLSAAEGRDRIPPLPKPLQVSGPPRPGPRDSRRPATRTPAGADDPAGPLRRVVAPPAQPQPPPVRVCRRAAPAQAAPSSRTGRFAARKYTGLASAKGVQAACHLPTCSIPPRPPGHKGALCLARSSSWVLTRFAFAHHQGWPSRRGARREARLSASARLGQPCAPRSAPPPSSRRRPPRPESDSGAACFSVPRETSRRGSGSGGGGLEPACARLRGVRNEPLDRGLSHATGGHSVEHQRPPARVCVSDVAQRQRGPKGMGAGGGEGLHGTQPAPSPDTSKSPYLHLARWLRSSAPARSGPASALPYTSSVDPDLIWAWRCGD